MATGRVKWFNNAKGYGFVRPDNGGDDLFVHYSYIRMEGYRTLKAGQPISYEVKPVDKGNHAVDITLLGEEHAAETPQHAVDSAGSQARTA